ncbi:NAD(P)H-binding protein [Halogeometricum sp. S1BR25-6]|uniref:NAD(P)H-binding protein n=1 Tax=Halogeometricum salsisoli TaxID=2950536 RepID=A0ABU2GAQ0_9EURY|nr:NAD(P)H-binding protein [Halogeometricum sp. S1BR25-6]MDS0297886.1 NAD(P)H-binding protein [Halogeometricum sp. S1BR25-6]
MDVLVTGGDGFVGRHLCAELVDRGHDVESLSRTPDPSVLPAEVTTTSGDVREFSSIEGAFEGKDAVVHLVALSPLYQHGISQEEVHAEGTENAVEAADARGVERFVQMSSIGTHPDGRTSYTHAKGIAEWTVYQSDLDWVVFRPSMIFGDGGELVPFTERFTTPYVTALPEGGRPPMQPIWVGDVVSMLAEGVEDGAHVRSTYELGGPEVLTVADVAREIYRARGQSLRVLPVPVALATLGLTLVDPLSVVPFGRDQARQLKMNLAVEGNDIGAFGRETGDLRTLGSYVRSE